MQSIAREISSVQNPEVKRLTRLRERRARTQERAFLIEGARELERAAQGGVPLRTLYMCEELFSPDAHQALPALHAPDRVHLSRAAFEKASVRENPDGLLAVADLPARPAPDLPHDALLLVLVGVEKPGNVGALLRSADGVGADAVLVVGGVDLENPNVIRASQGSVFTQTLFTLPEADALPWLRAQGFRVAAITPDGAQNYWDADLTGRVAVCLGAEHAGLPAAWREHPDLKLAIPMRGAADSLNVSTAGALVLYEALRQRGPREQ
ncbi:TrmH family RNA methyltransferase [Deinococcus maricopensis]|uniref:tRNA/rRNA methyltransferase (SpoU) n=1 Tax=Deinococcus maricopensis (strain DSM 21211 / LMG 22137 / NRRL B-23946 / LB-34) TaxID=709986 RepID=E8U8P2_DEIML|nr:RNA methyltransferase [Deinococcus maricopensis]ADV67431.1 tRNA/rRNA methyltransferase (SpoU) [Deinococcus maricopensis DSM 21211]